MYALLRDSNRHEIDQELQTSEFRELLASLRESESGLKSFSDWDAVLATMRSRCGSSEFKNGIFAAILRESQTRSTPEFGYILLALFWMPLVSIHLRKAAWDNDPDALWQNITLVFFEALKVADRSDPRLLQHLYGAVKKRLRRIYRRQWRYEQRNLVTPPQRLARLVGVDLCEPLKSVEYADFVDVHERRLDDLVQRLLLSADQAALIFFTRVLGARLPDYCRRCGIAIERTRKQRERVEAALRIRGITIFQKTRLARVR